jgi:hypothetical protein
VAAAEEHPDKFCILGHFDLQAANREEIGAASSCAVITANAAANNQSRAA